MLSYTLKVGEDGQLHTEGWGDAHLHTEGWGDAQLHTEGWRRCSATH